MAGQVQNVVPGTPEDQDAYRGELSGLYALVCMLESICKHHGIQGGSKRVGCDGEEALNKVMNWHSHVNAESPHADMILAIRNKVQATNITWKYKQVKGHQDDYRDYDSLDRMSQLNVLMDGSAKAYLAA